MARKNDINFFYDNEMSNPDKTISVISGEKVIFKSIIVDDLQISISHNWTNGQADPISGFVQNQFNSLRSNTRALNYAADGMQQLATMAGLDKASSLIGGMKSTLNNVASSALITAADNFLMFNGTDIGYNPSVTGIIFDDGENDVRTQLIDLIKTCLGDFSTEQANRLTGNLLEGWFALQSPPHGFKSDFKNLEIPPSGTLSIQYGNLYRLKYLVLNSMNVVLSKTRTRDTDSNGDPKPLYAEITMEFRPSMDPRKKQVIDLINNTK